MTRGKIASIVFDLLAFLALAALMALAALAG